MEIIVNITTAIAVVITAIAVIIANMTHLH